MNSLKNLKSLSAVSFLVMQVLMTSSLKAHPGYDLDFCPDRQKGITLSLKQRDAVLEKLQDVYPGFNFKEVKTEFSKDDFDRNKFVFKLRKILPGLSGDDPYFDICRSSELSFQLKQSDIINLGDIHISEDKTQYVPTINIKKITPNIDILFKQALRKLSSKYPDKKLSAIIINLQGNLGGDLDAISRLADLFLPPDKVIVGKTDIQESKSSVQYISKHKKLYYNMPILFKIDGETASAAELFVHALENNRKGVLTAGKPSYGKNSFQNIEMVKPNPKDNTQDLQMRYTAGKWINQARIIPKIFGSNSSIQGYLKRILVSIFSKK